MKQVRVYQCEDTPESIFSGIYDAGKSKYGHDYIRLEILSETEPENIELFSEYVTVTSDPEKEKKVLRSVKKLISPRVYFQLLRVVCSDAPDKADVMYHYIVYGFAMGENVVDALQIPCVHRMFELDRNVGNEAHYFLEFLRFQEVNIQGHSLLFATFEPRNRVLSLVTDHFADRLNPEWFIIYDKRHREAAFHSPLERWYIRHLEPEECRRLEQLEQQGEEYADLWRAFFESISIRERENPELQRSNLPLHYRKHMTEFSEKESGEGH